MSLRISVLALALLAGTPVAHAATLRVDGEVYAQRSAQLVPPAVDRLWQFNLTQLAPDGSTVKKGDIVVAFDTNELVRQLAEKQSLLQEKKRELENLTLDVAERERSQHLLRQGHVTLGDSVCQVRLDLLNELLSTELVKALEVAVVLRSTGWADCLGQITGPACALAAHRLADSSG